MPMSRVIQFPYEKRGSLRAVAYGVQDCCVYDDAVDERQMVYSALDLPEAVQFMEWVNHWLELRAKAEAITDPRLQEAARELLVLPASYCKAALYIQTMRAATGA